MTAPSAEFPIPLGMDPQQRPHALQPAFLTLL
jgi:hypothetical protein